MLCVDRSTKTDSLESQAFAFLSSLSRVSQVSATFVPSLSVGATRMYKHTSAQAGRSDWISDTG